MLTRMRETKTLTLRDQFNKIDHMDNDFKHIVHMFEDTYIIDSVIGMGGMGKAYLAYTKNLKTKWAIKQVNKLKINGFDFKREAIILKNIKHPTFPMVIDLLEEDKYIYIIQEFIEGKTLSHYIKENGNIHTKQSLKWVLELTKGIAYLHSIKIIHRDIKPQNIIIKPTKEIAIVDFGISKINHFIDDIDLLGMGTEGYAAPEQYNKRMTDYKTDIYAIGITIHFMLTGKKPYRDKYGTLTLDSDIPIEIQEIIYKCTKKNIFSRYQNVQQLIHDIERVLNHKKKKFYINKNFHIKKVPIPKGGLKRLILFSFLMVSIYYVDYNPKLLNSSIYDQKNIDNELLKNYLNDLNKSENKEETVYLYFKIADMYKDRLYNYEKYINTLEEAYSKTKGYEIEIMQKLVIGYYKKGLLEPSENNHDLLKAKNMMENLHELGYEDEKYELYMTNIQKLLN